MKGSRHKENNIIELYIHIPFCVKKCSYCDFLSFPGKGEVQRAYIEALFAEIKGRAGELEDYLVSTVFVGGGTPSVLPGEWMEELFGVIREVCHFVAEPEISIEVNPGTVDEEKLRNYRKAGINRLSIGLQSANDKELEKLGRIHTYEDFLATYHAARKVGFDNINVDIMSALPGQSLDSYRETLGKVLGLTPSPEHISAYSLIVEEGTPFAFWAEEGRLELPEEDCERIMYQETKRILSEAGLERYEISNYAKPGYECRHNCGYWLRTDYMGFGIGAASLVGNCRFRNDVNLEAYLKNPLACRVDLEELTVSEQMEETMFLGLRMTEGVSSVKFRESFGCCLEEIYDSVIKQNIEQGLLEYRNGKSSEQDDEMYLALTEYGLDVSNYVMAQFLLEETE